MSWDFNDIETPESEAVQAEREIVEEIVRNERQVQTIADAPCPPEHLDPGAHGCDRCGKVTDLFHNERTGLSLCERCDIEADEQPATGTVRFKRLRNGAWGITGPSTLLVPDTLVAVTKRDGSSTTVRVSRVLWSGDGKAICTTRRA